MLVDAGACSLLTSKSNVILCMSLFLAQGYNGQDRPRCLKGLAVWRRVDGSSSSFLSPELEPLICVGGFGPSYKP